MKQYNNNTSVCPFYTDIQEQNHRKSYAYGDIFPLIAPINMLLPFQVMREARTEEITEHVSIERVGASNNQHFQIVEMNFVYPEADYMWVNNNGTVGSVARQGILSGQIITYGGTGVKVVTTELPNDVVRALVTNGGTILKQINNQQGGTFYISTPDNATEIRINDPYTDRQKVTKVYSDTIYYNGCIARYPVEQGKTYCAEVRNFFSEVEDIPLAIFRDANNSYIGEQYITQAEIGTDVELVLPNECAFVDLQSASSEEEYTTIYRVDVTTVAKHITEVKMYDKDGANELDITSEILSAGLQAVNVDDVDVILFPANILMTTEMEQGIHYITMTDGEETWYSEMFTLVNDVSGYLKIEWWDIENLIFDSGIILYESGDFKNILYLCTELGKPEYQFEEEGETRNGYFFPQKQISEKTYKATILAPEYMCDVMRFIRMADYVQITDKYGKRYNADTFLITPKWEVQGNLASVEIEFETDTVVKKVGKGYTTI